MFEPHPPDSSKLILWLIIVMLTIVVLVAQVI